MTRALARAAFWVELVSPPWELGAAARAAVAAGKFGPFAVRRLAPFSRARRPVSTPQRLRPRLHRGVALAA